MKTLANIVLGAVAVLGCLILFLLTGGGRR